MRGVDFDDLESGLACPARGGRKSFHDGLDFGFAQFGRRWLLWPERNGTGRDNLPSAFGFRDAGATLPRSACTALPARVRKLYAGRRALRKYEPRNTSEHLD